MGQRRRKNRTHLKGPAKGETEENVPKSFVIKSGQVTKSISQLVRDTRQLMEPNTASRLRERPHARLRDYLTMAPSLHVTHLLAFTLTDAANVHLRVARLPQGPTLTFRVQRYSLMKDLVNASLRNIGKTPGGEFRNPPLLVLNNFQQPAEGPQLPQLRLMSTMFQGLFPAISVEKSALPTFRRVLLLSYNHTTHLISLRHYSISVRPHGVSRRVRRLLNPSTGSVKTSRKTPNLATTDDIADYLLRRPGTPGSEVGTAGYDSMSETDASEAESDTNAVELPEDYVGRGNKKGERKAVRLVETGPRMELKLIKVVEGLVGSKKGEGETVFHEFVHKSKAESTALNKSHQERKRAKDARRAEQAANVARKKAEKASKKGEKGEDDEGGEEEDDDDIDVDGLSDVDPEEALERRRTRLSQADDGDADEEEFQYEDAAGLQDGEREDDGDWDEDVDAGDVSSGEEQSGESSEDDEPAPPPKRRNAGKR
ncbi:putative rRNA binding protein [Naematelia encephala]|uniref:Putative rRNA binding protein n=1 Tax=Naematelia encephala TaxID=71784 RepID=A0A1Y2AZ04_9TREE|nr:putative rRNA binding protein [Naematelia encephala]